MIKSPRGMEVQRHVDRALASIVRQGCMLVPAERCAILLPDERDRWLSCAALHDHARCWDRQELDRLRLPLRRFSAIRAHLAATHEPLAISADTEHAALFPAGVLDGLDARSLLLAPLHLDDALAGVLLLYDPGVQRTFSPEECATAAALADLATVALTTAQAVAREQHRRRVDAGLRDLVTRISRLTTPHAILEVAVEHVSAVFGADAASAWLFGPEQRLSLAASSGFSRAYLEVAQAQYSRSPGYNAFAQGRTVYIVDRAADTDPIGIAATVEGIRSMLYLPLLVEERPVGLLILAYHEIQPPDQELMAQAEGFAQQAALAIHTAKLLRATEDLAAENARLYQSEAARARQLDALLRLSERLHATGDFDTLMQEVVDAVTSTLGFRIAVLNVRSEIPGAFVVRAVSGAGPDERAQLLGSVSDDWDLFLQPAFRTGRSYLVPPEHNRSVVTHAPFVVPDLPPANPGEWDAYHALFVPIGGDGVDAIAVLSVDEPLDRRLPSSATLAALEAFAAQTALALEKARLLAETQRRASESEGIIGSIMDAVIVISPDGIMHPLNQTARLLVQPGGALAPERRAALLDIEGTILRPDQLPMARALQGEHVPPTDLLVSLNHDALGWFSVTGAPIVDAGGAVEAAVLVIRDVRAERDVERLRRQFVATISHELRTPLSAIVGFAELLHGRWDEIAEERRRLMIGHIIASGGRLARLVADLLLLSQVEAGELRVSPGVVDLRLVLEQAASEAQARFPGQVVLLPSADHPVLVWADRDRAQQVFSNLVDNAAKYAGEAGPVELRWDIDAHAVVVRVVDHGAGVAPEQQVRLFTRFGKLDQQQMRGGHVGTGLGLFICRKLIEAMGGSIWYEATPRGGSTFAARLPVFQTDPVQATAIAAGAGYGA